MRVKPGLEVLLRDGHPLIAGRRIGLLTHPAAIDGHARGAVDLLAADTRWTLVALFGPEHGIRGAAQAGEHVPSSSDPGTGLPIHSLYGATRVPTPQMLSGIETLVVDLQDIGVRYFTYAATVLGCIEAAAVCGIDVVILDRPAPLGGRRIEGGRLQEAQRSFVGVHPVPIRHGLTLGELMRLVAAERGWPEPAVVPVDGWTRGLWADQTGLRWAAPSPNLPTLEAVLLYAGTCLIEGTNLSEGRGTAAPFSSIGAPWIDPAALAQRLRARALAGVRVEPTRFRPTMSKHEGALCYGISLTVTDRDALRPVELGLAVLADGIALSGDRFAWRDAAFDRLAGDPAVRQTLQRGAPLDGLIAQWRADAHAFAKRRARYLLYRDERLS